MKKFNVSYVCMVLLAVFFGYSGSAFAELKIGYVNVAKLFDSSPQISAAEMKMDVEFRGREKEFVALQREIKPMEEALARDGAVMSDAERTKKERAILSKRREVKRVQEEFSDDLNIRKNEILRKVQTDISKAIDEYAKQNNFDLIVGQGVIYASDKVDITENVLKKLGGS